MHSLRWPAVVSFTFIVVTTFAVGKFGLYDSVPYLDKVFHAIGGAIAAWFFLAYFRNDFSGSSPKLRYIVAVVASVALVGVIWELAERLASLYGSPFLKHYFFGGDLNDTLVDLVADLAGAVVVAVSAVKQKLS